MDNSAAAMIQRFRNAKPTSREDREKQKEASGINKLWYETGDQEEVERPRALVVGPTGQPSRPSSALRNAREPNDYMASPSNSLYQNRKLGASVGLDDMISNEIRQLQAQMEEQDRATNARMNLGSFDPTHSLDRSYEGGPTYRFNARDSRDSLPRRSASPSPMRRSSQQPRNNGLSDSTDEFLRKYQVGSFGADAWRDSIAAGGGGAYRGDISPLRLSGDIMRSSVETLGSTGIRGLLVPHLKLDGKKEEKPVVEEVVKSDAELAEMNRQLEELLKSMNANHPPRNEYFPEGVAESILQITNKVQADMLDFKSLFGDKHQREDDEEKALKERDEKMKEEGRKQAREKQLLDIDLPASHPLEYFGVWDPAQQQQLPIMNNQRRLDYFPYPVSHATPQRPPQEPQHTPQSAHPVSLSQAMVGTAQQQIDLSELRLSDDGSVGSPFPQYNSTILSPEASNNNDNNKPKEGFAVGNGPVASAAAGATEPATPAPTSSAAAVAPTLASAGLLSGAAPMVASAGAGSQVPVDRSQVRGFGPTAGLVQSALDSEIAAVDTAYHQIRALHHQLGNRMRHLDALHSSVSVPPGPAGPTRGPVPVSAHQRSAQTHFRREGRGPGGVQLGGIPLYARPGGPPAHPHQAQHQPPHAQSGYPAGLGPMAVADNHYVAPVRAYSALEEYYNSLAEDQLAATQDTRTLFNPFPELVHSNILGVNKGIQAALDVTMRTLHARLPEEVVKRSPPVPAVHPTLAEATAAAAHSVLPAHSAPVAAPSVVPATATTSSSAAPKPSAEPALSSVVNKVASSLVEGVLDVSEYRKSAEGLLTRSFPPPTAPVDAAHAATAPVASAPVAPVVAAVSSSGATAAATGLKSYLDKVTEVAPAHATIPATAPAATPNTATVTANPETKVPSAGATALAAVAPGKSSREVLAELDSVLGVDDKQSNYLARDLFVPTSTANSFPAVSHAPPSAQEKPFLHAADAYLQSHYGRNTYDPRMQFDPPAQRSAQFGANKNNPVVIQAPSDHELLHRHPQFASQGGASAPPAAVEFAMARAHSPANPVSAPSRLYSQQASSSSSAVPSAHIAEVHQTNGYPAYPADPRRAVELANAQHLRRPVEGGAVNYLFENRIGVMATENGNKYVSPFVPAQEPTYDAGNAGYNSHYTNRQASPPARNKNDNFKNESKSSPPGYAASSAGKKIINLPSPTSIAAPHERQSYLAQMRQLRANLTGK